MPNKRSLANAKHNNKLFRKRTRKLTRAKKKAARRKRNIKSVTYNSTTFNKSAWAPNNPIEDKKVFKESTLKVFNSDAWKTPNLSE